MIGYRAQLGITRFGIGSLGFICQIMKGFVIAMMITMARQMLMIAGQEFARL